MHGRTTHRACRQSDLNYSGALINHSKPQPLAISACYRVPWVVVDGCGGAFFSQGWWGKDSLAGAPGAPSRRRSAQAPLLELGLEVGGGLVLASGAGGGGGRAVLAAVGAGATAVAAGAAGQALQGPVGLLEGGGHDLGGQGQVFAQVGDALIGQEPAPAARKHRAAAEKGGSRPEDASPARAHPRGFRLLLPPPPQSLLLLLLLLTSSSASRRSAPRQSPWT